MYQIKKTFEISAAHKLDLPYESKCNSLHGHNWTITVWFRSSDLDASGMVVDFSIVKQTIVGALDHRNLNEIIAQPTAERIATWIYAKLEGRCYRVRVIESEGSEAEYRVGL